MRRRVCAYCDVPCELTNEHLLPDCISKHWENNIETNVKAGSSERIITGDPEIGDVCGDCNHGPLSELDAYVCRLYKEHFVHLVRPGDRVKLDLDFDPLLRWLLKTAYNTARARKWSTSLAQFRGYIIGRDANRPPCRVLLQLVIPRKVKRGEIADFPEATEIPPEHHILSLMDVSLLPGFTTGFLLTLNSYFFYVVLEDLRAFAKTRARNYKAILRQTRGGYELGAKKHFTVYASSVDMLEAGIQREARIRNVLRWNDWKAKKK